MTEADQLARNVAHRVVRESYGKLVAYLSKLTGDVAGAEDCLADALAAALGTWPTKGVPANPEAWLTAVAKRKFIDFFRRQRAGVTAIPHLTLLAEEIEAMATVKNSIPDERLALMFACAHPALDPGIRTPLMLQTVLGLSASDIASAFLVAPSAMGQRLARAKQKIKLAGISFRVPDASELAVRLDSVLEAIYAAYSNGWSDPGNSAHNLAEEAIWLGRVVAKLLPDQPEASGLLALMLFLQSRCQARRDAFGNFVPLSQQDRQMWDSSMLRGAEECLRHASSLGVVGRFQLEAAIQSAHAASRVSGFTDWRAIVQFYEELLRITDSVVVALNLAVAVAEVEGAEAGLALFPRCEDHPGLVEFQPYHAARADLLARAGHAIEAQAAYQLAIGLEMDPAVRRFLQIKANSGIQ